MKTLIAYFSYTGHTKGIAQQLQELTGGTLFEIKTVVPYSDDYDTTERQGRKETKEGYRPPLMEMPAEPDSYDIVLLGTPNWFNTVAPPVASFLEKYDMSDKKIALFCTNGGGGLGHTEADIRTIYKDVEVLDSLNIYEDGGSDAKRQLAEWLKKIDMVQ